MGKTHRQDKRDHEGRDEIKAFYTRVQPVETADEEYYGAGSRHRAPGMLTNGSTIRKAHIEDRKARHLWVAR